MNGSLDWAHPLVRDWFLGKYAGLTEPQQQGWPLILAEKSTLISSPTGSGKTLAAFLVYIDKLIKMALDKTLEDQTAVLYISPLKALTNDVQKNLIRPMQEIQALALSRGIALQPVNIAVRTGDTLANERRRMLKKPPHILVTTPESLYLLLTAAKSRENLRHIQTVIVDEIHALVNNKRGSHLLLSLERLDHLCLKPPLRIALSATQKPLTRVADFISGSAEKAVIVSCLPVLAPDIRVECPLTPLSAVTSTEMWEEIYAKLTQLIEQNRSTLIFVNTRKLAEKIAHQLSLILGQEKVMAHHGSLSRKLRLLAETRLKEGGLKALVATASLELGIDIGTIDLVCQIGSTRSISVALQRIGRAGHWHGGQSKGVFFATTQTDLLEIAALVQAIKKQDLDELLIPEEPLDILSQQIVAACTEDWNEDLLYQTVKKASSFQHLTKKSFNQLLIILSEGIAGSRGRYGALLFRDKLNKRLVARRGTRLQAILNGGAIADTGLFSVISQAEGAVVGTIDEEFVIESHRGDVILLGSSSWRIQRIEPMKSRVLVENAFGATPTVPFWQGEAPSRTKELSLYLSNLVQTVEKKLASSARQETVKAFLMENCALEESAATQLIDYFLQGIAVLGAVPSQKKIIAERFFDESGGMQLIIHSPFGTRINKAWGLALRKRFCRTFNFELQAAATDDGINISLAEQHSFPLQDVFHFLSSKTLKKVLTQAVLQTPIFKTRWRWVASRALALPRFRMGKKVPHHIIRMLSDDLLAAVFPDAAACQDNLLTPYIVIPPHPYIDETFKEIFADPLDLAGLTRVIQQIETKEISCISVDTPLPSIFSQAILNANPYAFLDDAPLEERRARAVQMRQILPADLLRNIGRLDATVIEEVQNQILPDIQNADELQDFLQTCIIMPKTFPRRSFDSLSLRWTHFYRQLQDNGNALTAQCNNKDYWLVAEKKQIFKQIYPLAKFNSRSGLVNQAKVTRDEALLALVKGWSQYLGPFTAEELGQYFDLDLQEINTILLRVELGGSIIRGQFRSASQGLEWCDRRILARIHRLSLEKLRQAIRPVDSKQFITWLFKWQHLTHETRLQGEKGLLELITKMQGVELAANSWEKDFFKSRIEDYNPEWLDKLCLMGIVSWGRLNLPKFNQKGRIPAQKKPAISFYPRGKSVWLEQSGDQYEAIVSQLSTIATAIYSYLKEQGASFFIDIVHGVHYLKTQVEIALLELVAAGLVTADSFANLRQLMAVRKKSSRYREHLFPARWALLVNKNTRHQEEDARKAWCNLLLRRYGIVTRGLIKDEKPVFSWRELLPYFRQMEAQGEIRGGRFIEQFSGEQYALPVALASLRQSVDPPKT